jgi:hypothetical protein
MENRLILMLNIYGHKVIGEENSHFRLRLIVNRVQSVKYVQYTVLFSLFSCLLCRFANFAPFTRKHFRVVPRNSAKCQP